VFRELPILREESAYAAEMALASREQGKFLDFHFAMMNATGTLTKDRVLSIAKQTGLNTAALEKAQKDPSVDEAIRSNKLLAQSMGAEGTPTFIIAAVDGSYVNVIEGYSEEAVRDSIAKAKAATR
jgi:protein-disulfide isomerase